MSWGRVKVIERPTSAPITLSDLKARLRVDFSDDDTIISQMLNEAIQRIDGPHGVGYAMMRQKWRLTLDDFPYYTGFYDNHRYDDGSRRRFTNSSIVLPGAPVIAVTAVKYLDFEGIEQTFAAENYRVVTDFNPARIVLRRGKHWPDTEHTYGSVAVEYTLGADNNSDVPADLIGAVSLFAAHRYENREAVSEIKMSEIPLGFMDIISDYRQAWVSS